MDRRTLFKAALFGHTAALVVEQLPVLFPTTPKCDPTLYGFMLVATHPEANASIIVNGPEGLPHPVIAAEYNGNQFTGYRVLLGSGRFFYPATGEKPPFITEYHSLTDFGGVRVHVQNHESHRSVLREILAAEPSNSVAVVGPDLFTVVTHTPKRKS